MITALTFILMVLAGILMSFLPFFIIAQIIEGAKESERND